MEGGNYLLIADETALPLLDARLRALDGKASVIVLTEAPAARLAARPGLTVHSVDRHAAAGPRSLNDVLRGLFLPQGALRVWVSCPAPEARLICAQLIDDHGVRRENLEAPAAVEPVLYVLDALA